MGERIAHYEIVERLGEGGMGIVYRATDTKLERAVALKFLSPDLRSSPEDIERFLHEARALSRLNHPNIATIYAVEEHRGERFLALEHLPGGTLREAIDHSAEPLSIKQLLPWALGMACGLAHAHRHGIVHRDVKADNVLLTADGGVKLTDFGVAQVAGRATSDAGMTLGTAAFMSPEQAQGMPADHRSDIFSYGLLLYELCAGRPAFGGTEAEVILYDIVHSPAPPLDGRVPAGLRSLIDRLIAKDPDERFQSMDDVIERLSRLGEQERPKTAPASRSGIAVLPFVDMSPERDQEYFCDGVAEEITFAISRVDGLKVVSRASAFQFKDRPYDIEEVARRLDVSTVLEGSVRKAGDRLRVAVQLIDGEDGRHLWSEKYDRALENIFEVQDEIAGKVATSLKGRLLAKVSRRPQTSNLEAYTCYLNGRYRLNQRTKGSLREAVEFFKKAAELDPEYALAYSGLAEWAILTGGHWLHPDGQKRGMEEARQAALKAIELGPELAEAHTALALVRVRADWDFAGAESEFKRAIQLNPGYATAHHQYALYLAQMNRIDEAIAEIRRAQELDPLSLIISTAIGRILHFARRYDEAVEQCRRTIALDPKFRQAYFDLAIGYGQMGDIEASKDAIRKMDELDPDELTSSIMWAAIHARTGDRERALELRAVAERLAQARGASPVVLVVIDFALGEIDRAMDALFEALEAKDGMLLYMQCESTYDPIRDHPRYTELIRRVGFP